MTLTFTSSWGVASSLPAAEAASATEASNATATAPTTVAIIGCGPGGMFFCHALETQRQKLLQEGSSSADQSAKQLLSTLPVVTCFERAANPGGVWRSKRQHHHHSPHEEDCNDPALFHYNDDKERDDTTTTTTNMYEALWTNGPKECIEFFDYTYDDHFQRQLPVYMPRQAILEYMTARVTRNCPDFFEKYVKFQTSVESVTFLASQNKFQVTTRHVATGTTTLQTFDKCIWAAGENGKPKMPKDIVNMLQDGGFQGRIMHSSDAHHLKDHVQGKRVLLVGGGYSAEDLALMAIKLGVEKVMITSRSADAFVAYTSAWPMDKVQVYTQRVPVRVVDGGRSIQLAAVDYTWPDQYHTRRDNSNKAETLRDIDTVIFCTGYQKNMDMLDKSLQRPFHRGYNDRFTAFPENWKMADNVLSDGVVVGHVEPGDVRYRLGGVMPGLYRGVLIDNPSMMYLLGEFSEYPLLATDVNAWLLLGFITGNTATPLPSSPEEMNKLNDEQALRELNMPYLRYEMDSNYRNKLDQLDGFWAETDNDDGDVYHDPRWYQAEAQFMIYEIQRLGQFMQQANYPLSLLDGTKQQNNHQEQQQQQQQQQQHQPHLNDRGLALFEFSNATYYHRLNLAKSNNINNNHDTNNDEHHPGWWKAKTFRDCDAESARQFYSIHTGTRAIPLKSLWMDFDDHNHDPNLL